VNCLGSTSPIFKVGFGQSATPELASAVEVMTFRSCAAPHPGTWTILTGVLILDSPAFPMWLGWLAIPIGVAQLIGALEFVGPNEPDGWKLAGRVVPVAYIVVALVDRMRRDPALLGLRGRAWRHAG
jgi:hypothetical protein